jgi:hypothetical protein
MMQVAMAILPNRFALSQFLIKLSWIYFIPSPLMTRNHFLHGSLEGRDGMFYSIFEAIAVLIGAC